MKKIPKQAYTTEFKELAVKRVTDGESVTTVVKELGLGDQTLRNWVKASAAGKLKVFYNRTRQHSTLGYQSPIQYLDQWRNEQHQEKLAA